MNEEWLDGETELKEGDMMILLGEELEEENRKNKDQLPIKGRALEHCVKVDPYPPHDPLTNWLPDALAPPEGNRLSVAFLLSNGNKSP